MQSFVPSTSPAVLPEQPGLCQIVETLRAAKLRPTRQRVALAGILLTDVDKHLSAEGILCQAHQRGFHLSLATVYNTVEAFCRAGFIRRIAVASKQALYDRGTVDHHHFFVENEDELIDIAPDAIFVRLKSNPPPGFVVAGIDVIVRLRRVTHERHPRSGETLVASHVEDYPCPQF